jgi:hypothetical protein
VVPSLPGLIGKSGSGSKWIDEIRTALAKARVAVLLVTKDFLASDFIHDEELNPLLLHAKRGGVRILWIPVRASSFHKSPIKDYQALIEPNIPLAQMRAHRDTAWVEICKEIERAVTAPLNPLTDDAADATKPELRVVHAEQPTSQSRHWLQELHQRLAKGDLRDSPLAPTVVEVLHRESRTKPVETISWSTVVAGIRASDRYFVRVQPSAGIRDWQRDFAQTVTPTLVAMAHSLDRSPDAQATVLRLCDAIAARLRLRLLWPQEPDQFNDLTNAIYAACLRARELECDDVLVQLKGLPVVGPE